MALYAALARLCRRVGCDDPGAAGWAAGDGSGSLPQDGGHYRGSVCRTATAMARALPPNACGRRRRHGTGRLGNSDSGETWLRYAGGMASIVCADCGAALRQASAQCAGTGAGGRGRGGVHALGDGLGAAGAGGRAGPAGRAAGRGGAGEARGREAALPARVAGAPRAGNRRGLNASAHWLRDSGPEPCRNPLAGLCDWGRMRPALPAFDGRRSGWQCRQVPTHASQCDRLAPKQCVQWTSAASERQPAALPPASPQRTRGRLG